MSSPNDFMQKLIRVTMRPLIRIMIRYGIGYGDFSAVVKRIFIEVAENDFKIDGRKQTISRVSVLTGITRREIKKILDNSSTKREEEVFVYNHAARIISCWLHDEEFQLPDGTAAALSTKQDGEGTFNNLVYKYGNNTPSRAILDELVRVGAVELDEIGMARMVSLGYVPSEDTQELLSVSFQSVADLISTIDYNDRNRNADTRLQLTVNYDNVSDEGVEVFRHVSREKSKEVLLFLDRFLATQDKDNNPAIAGKGANRTGLGIFFFEERKNEK
jgi:hypothetical protein